VSGAVAPHEPDAPRGDTPYRISRRRFLSFVALAPAVAAGCTTTTEVTVNLDDNQTAFGFRVAEFETEAGATANDSLASLVKDLPSLPIGDIPDDSTLLTPVGFRAPSIRIENATTVVSVGVDDDGNFDVPARSEIGWYRFGPEPGAEGSSVLAAHITLDGVDGAFRYLAEFSAGDVISVIFDDGTERDFEVQALAQYDKDVLPLDRLFDRTGPARLVLITCGGVFNPQVDSFEDNLIVYAVPV